MRLTVNTLKRAAQENGKPDVAETGRQPWMCLTPGFLDLPGSVLIALHALTFFILAALLV